ncbi:unnamed protein product, partial [marine sediment metagenome]
DDNFLIFEADESGELRKLNITEEQFRTKEGRDVLDSEKVLIIAKIDLQRIYIWKGADSHARKRFISSRLAQTLLEELQGDLRCDRCKIVSVDAGDEPSEFLKAFGFKSKEVSGHTKRINISDKPEADRNLFGRLFCENCGMELQNLNQKLCSNCRIPLRKLDSGECYVIVSGDKRKVYIWKGLRSSVRSRFIGAKRAQEISDRYGKDYKIISVNEGKEDSEFLELINKLEEKDSDRPAFDEDNPSPFPFIPPSPPGATGGSEQNVQLVVSGVDLEDELYCKYCGSDLQEGQSICHVCGNKVE